MGNYKSRPKSSCSRELLQKILENYALLEEKLQEDLHGEDVEDCTDTQRICCDGTTDQLVNLLSSENYVERIDNDMTLMHLCCLSSVGVKNGEAEEKKDNEVDIRKVISQAPCFLQLMRSSCDKSHQKVGVQDNEGNKVEPDAYRQYMKMQTSKEIKDQIRLLLQKGADPSIISINGFSPLHLASYKVKPVDCLRWLTILPAWSDLTLVYSKMLEWFRSSYEP